jgi:hypothetical protein
VVHTHERLHEMVRLSGSSNISPLNFPRTHLKINKQRILSSSPRSLFEGKSECGEIVCDGWPTIHAVLSIVHVFLSPYLVLCKCDVGVDLLIEQTRHSREVRCGVAQTTT